MKTLATALLLGFSMTTATVAEEWVLDGDASRLAFGSVKLNLVGEISTFSGLSGRVSEDGTVSVDIDLSTVDTAIPIRDERMVEFVFKHVPKATLSAKVDMDALNALPVGDMSIVDVEGSLSLVGAQVPVSTQMFVARLSDTRVLVTTNDMVFLSTASAGIDEGVTALQEIAKLTSITRVVPVTLRLVFDERDPNT